MRCETIRTVAIGESLLAPSITRKLIDAYTSRPERSTPRAEIAELTERELEVLKLVAAGLTNREIADHLALSPLTAKTHVSRILSKLGARDSVQLVVIACQTGIVE
jgi:DNA-binding NarL/FixJ family response regulator